MESDFGLDDLDPGQTGDGDAAEEPQFPGDEPADELLSATADEMETAIGSIGDAVEEVIGEALDGDDPDEVPEPGEGTVAGAATSTVDVTGTVGSFFDFVRDVSEDDLHGEIELEWAQAQSENGFCVPVSVAMIVSEMTGTEVTEDATVDAAVDLDLLYGEPGNWIGMTSYGTVELLEHYGVEADVEFGELEDLTDYLDEGRNIMVSVDASEIWYGDGQTYDPGNELPHAAVITAIDVDDGVVYLNDPGVPADMGAGMEVPLEIFLGAWEDTGNEMVVTVEPTPDVDVADVADPVALDTGTELPVDPAAADSDLGGLGSHLAPVGMVILPVSFVAASVTLGTTAGRRQQGTAF